MDRRRAQGDRLGLRAGRCTGAAFGNGSENTPESTRIERHAARTPLGRTGPGLQEKAAYNAESGSFAMQMVVGSSPISRFRVTSATKRFLRLPALPRIGLGGIFRSGDNWWDKPRAQKAV